ncbi:MULTISPECIES: histidine phosphatase family protein [Bacillus]|uniref:histidine phosphatase family protein n=1 Tax=Bacillus TaxID=1386 RepID=UPI000C7568AA|nr:MULTISPECIES: histidine phosphatase family protein [Bacillus]MCR6608955.1 histidine phosphatase family protein [Bacillus infantis]PLR70411.1 histidine phosphatase family protein [Bacillus sp. UMB0728]
MLDLYFVRHGETEWNKAGRMQGRLDSNLTEKGLREAERLGEHLQEMQFDEIISSPSSRTIQTAEKLAGSTAAIRTDERLMEIHLGQWQGKTGDEIKMLFPEQYGYYWNEPAKFENPEGETFPDVKTRLAGFLQELGDSRSTGKILIVTHAVVIKTAVMLANKVTVNEIWEPPFIHGTSLTHMKYRDEVLELVLAGDLSHIGVPG